MGTHPHSHSDPIGSRGEHQRSAVCQPSFDPNACHVGEPVRIGAIAWAAIASSTIATSRRGCWEIRSHVGVCPARAYLKCCMGCSLVWLTTAEFQASGLEPGGSNLPARQVDVLLSFRSGHGAPPPAIKARTQRAAKHVPVTILPRIVSALTLAKGSKLYR